MKEFRRSRRRQLAETVQVTDCMTEMVIGHIGNVSETVMLVMSNAPLVADALYQLRFGLPDGPVRLPFAPLVTRATVPAGNPMGRRARDPARAPAELSVTTCGISRPGR